MSADLNAACEQLVKALRDHAAALSQDNAPARTVAPAMAEVRSAARSYADAIFEATGWGNVFADINDQGDKAEADEQTSLIPGETMRLSVRARWDFIAEDPDALMRHAHQRLIENGWDEHRAEEHTDSPTRALATLVHLDNGWEPENYAGQGATPAGNDWITRTVEKTLNEMDPAERSATDL